MNDFQPVFEKLQEYRSELSWKDSGGRASFEVTVPDFVQIERDDVEELRQLAVQMADEDTVTFTTT
jgi:hypothetical protein